MATPDKMYKAHELIEETPTPVLEQVCSDLIRLTSELLNKFEDRKADRANQLASQITACLMYHRNVDTSKYDAIIEEQHRSICI